MKIKQIILAVSALFALIGGTLGYYTPSKVGATPILAGYAGGTGVGSAVAGDIGKVLTLTNNSPLTYALQSASAGSQTPWGSNIEGANYSLSHVGSLDATSSSFTDATTTHLAVIGTATTTFAGGINIGANHIVAHGIQSDASDGLHIHAGNGTNVGLFGAGNSANSLFYGGVNIDGATRLAISLNGLAFLTNGAVTDIATSSLNLTTSSFLSANISQWTNDSGYITSSSLPVGANPTGTIGLSAVNGVATTFLRSDGAPALSQSITPTWTGLHIFSTGGFISRASSTAQWLKMDNSTSTSATSTDLYSLRALFGTLNFTNATGTNLFASQGIFTRASSTQATTTNFFTNSLMSIIANLGKATSSTMAVTGEATTSSMTISNQLKMKALQGQGVAVGVDSSGLFYGFATTTTRYYSFNYATTTWTGSSTAQVFAPFPASATLQTIFCNTNTGSVDVKWSYGPTPTDVYVLTASTTIGVKVLSGTVAQFASSSAVFGNPASSPTSVACTVKVSIANP